MVLEPETSASSGKWIEAQQVLQAFRCQQYGGWNNMVLYDRESPGGDCVPRMALHGRVLGDL